MSDSPSCDSCGRPHGLWATDRLTLLLDRWGWDDQAPAVLAQSQSTALLVVDVDNFKRVNDRFGHVAGDEVLKAVADTLRRITRKSDLLGRYGGQGGDEFLVMLPETSAEAARAIAERIRLGIRSMTVPVPIPGGTTTIESVTVSIGVSVGGAGTDLQTLVVEADAALRGAKRTGRDQVRTSVPAARRRAIPLRLAVLGACAAGALIVFATDTPPPAEQSSAAELPHPATTSQPSATTVTVPTTITATTVLTPPPVAKPRVKKPTATVQPAARDLEKPPPSSQNPCLACDMLNSVISGIAPMLAR